MTPPTSRARTKTSTSRRKTRNCSRPSASGAKAAAEEATRALHFMKCPKDGHDLVHEEFHGVTVDRCVHCQGIWLDADEMRPVVAHDDPTLLGRVLRDLSAVLRAPRPESP